MNNNFNQENIYDIIGFTRDEYYHNSIETLRFCLITIFLE